MRRGTVRFDAGTCIDSNFAVISVTVAIAVRTSATDIKASILILFFSSIGNERFGSHGDRLYVLLLFERWQLMTPSACTVYAIQV